MFASIRTGAWLTEARARVYCWIFLAAFGATLIAILVTAKGDLDYFKRPIGIDFSGVYAAGRSAEQGRAFSVYDNKVELAQERKIFGPTAPFLSWSYPPFFFFVAALFASAPYLVALAGYQVSTLALLLAAMSRIKMHRRRMLPVLAFPGFFINLLNGQNGFLTAGLLTWALVLLGDHPILAGVFFGLLSYKPQFCVLIPFALLAGRRWRALASAAVTFTAMVAATALALGAETWRAFFASTAFARQMTENGSVGFFKIQTVFSTVRQLGGGVEAAYFAQAVSALISVVVVTTLWARSSDWRLKSACLMAATLLATPYAMDYDLAILGPAILLVASAIAERDPLPWEISALAFAWFIPALARPFSFATHFSWGALAAAVVLLVTWRAACPTKPVVSVASSSP